MATGRVISGQPRVMSAVSVLCQDRGLRIPARDRDDVLERARELYSDHVATGVDRKDALRRLLRSARARRRMRRQPRRSAPLADLGGETGAGERCESTEGGTRRTPGHERQVSASIL